MASRSSQWLLVVVIIAEGKSVLHGHRLIQRCVDPKVTVRERVVGVLQRAHFTHIEGAHGIMPKAMHACRQSLSSTV
jgi:hypothetical protein